MTIVDPSLKPFKIGFTNQEGGTPAYPEHSAAAKAPEWGRPALKLHPLGREWNSLI